MSGDIMNLDKLEEEIVKLKQNNRVFYEYLKAFYNIEKVKEEYKNKDDFKRIEELLKKENDN